MEKIGDKIKRTIKEKGFKTIKAFYARLTDIYGRSAINRSTLTRLLKGQVEVRERTLNQIAIILGVKTSFLREGTDAEVSAIDKPEGIFTYNDKATLKILQKGLPFTAEQLALKVGGRTADLQDSAEAKESLKWIYVLVGKINVVIKEDDSEKIQTLHKSQNTYFDARKLHRIENVSKSTSLCLCIHYPAANSKFSAIPA
jgi:transcriptional regulator with XRE-family HTH domain